MSRSFAAILDSYFPGEEEKTGPTKIKPAIKPGAYFDMKLVSAIHNLCNNIQFDNITETDLYSALNLQPANIPLTVKPGERTRMCYMIHKLYEYLKQSASGTHTSHTIPSEVPVSTEPSANSGDALNSTDTEPTVLALDTDPIRRTMKQRKSDLDEYKRRYMPIPRIVDRKPVFLSHETRDRLDRIVRLLGERGMSVSGLVENIALRHLEIHEPAVEQWRKM